MIVNSNEKYAVVDIDEDGNMAMQGKRFNLFSEDL
jgi:hypothetical protein